VYSSVQFARELCSKNNTENLLVPPEGVQVPLGGEPLEPLCRLALALCHQAVTISSKFKCSWTSSCYSWSLTCLGFWSKVSHL